MGGSWGIGEYEGSREVGPDEAWAKTKVTLKSPRADDADVSFTVEQEEAVVAVAELVHVVASAGQADRTTS